MSAYPSARSRAILPITDRPHTGPRNYDSDYPESKLSPNEPVRPPESAPNVLIILLDDVGFALSSAFGGPCQTPNFEKLAAGGLRFSRFHTTAQLSLTRQALLTGRNHPSAGMGRTTGIATSVPGYIPVLPKCNTPLAQILKLNGYSTAQFGKCHEIPGWQTSSLGLFDQWPTRSGGFEYFYGSVDGDANQGDPALYEGTTPIDPPKAAAEGYHFTEDIADKAIAWVCRQKALTPDKPFFAYFAPGACHAAGHVPKEWADKYKGKFNKGWDHQREESFARQKSLQVVPESAVLSDRPEDVPSWDDIEPKLKPVLLRQMEIYAGFLEHTDHHVGRLIKALRDLDVLNDTLVYLIMGASGDSIEGTLEGARNQSWAQSMGTPHQWTKQVASRLGGARSGTIVHWPNGIQKKAEIRSQFCDVLDVAPTILEAAAIPEPESVNGVQQIPMGGTSMLYSFNDSAAAERRQLQYFEMFRDRGVHDKEWPEKLHKQTNCRSGKWQFHVRLRNAVRRLQRGE